MGGNDDSEAVWEAEEMIGGTVWGGRVVSCPVCAGSGRRMVGDGQIAVKGRLGRRLRRARLLRCPACRGAGLLAR